MINCSKEFAFNKSGASSQHLLATPRESRGASRALPSILGTVLIFSCLSFSLPIAHSKPIAPEKVSEKKAEKEKSKSLEAVVEKKAQKEKSKPLEAVIENVQSVTAEQLVEKPHEYFNKNVKFTSVFHSFTTVGLDYKPAMRPSKTNLSFFVFRQGTHVPLSELKLDMPLPKEKDPENQMLAQLKDGDTVEVIGHVFATALDDPWVDVLKLKKIASAPEDKKISAEKEKREKDAAENPTPEQKPTGPKDGPKLELKGIPDKKGPETEAPVEKTAPSEKKNDDSKK